MDPSDFHTGIAAELYGPLKSTKLSWEPYAKFIAEAGQPALELGCGGEPILDLRRNGFDVDGVGSSADMLARCSRKAAEDRIGVGVFLQRMEWMSRPWWAKSSLMQSLPAAMNTLRA